MTHNRLSYGCVRVVAPLVFSLACSSPTDGHGAPVAEFSKICAALRCDFTDKSTDDGAMSTWEWSFGDAAIGTEQNPFYLYGEPGTYTVTLTVHDAAGASDTQ